MRFSHRLLTLSSRRAVAITVVLSHLLAATGLPVPALRQSATAKTGSPHPCQDRPCGCSTTEQAWGDCCCFTQKEKLAWAADRGIVMPDHVRSADESRKTKLSTSKPSCCSVNVDREPQQPKCAALRCEHEHAACLSAPTSSCCEHKAPEPAQPAPAEPIIHWIVLAFAQQCRGEGPAGLLKLEVLVAPDFNSHPLATLTPIDLLDSFNSRVTSHTHHPPTPPPRLC